MRQGSWNRKLTMEELEHCPQIPGLLAFPTACHCLSANPWWPRLEWAPSPPTGCTSGWTLHPHSCTWKHSVDPGSWCAFSPSHPDLLLLRLEPNPESPSSFTGQPWLHLWVTGPQHLQACLLQADLLSMPGPFSSYPRLEVMTSMVCTSTQHNWSL